MSKPLELTVYSMWDNGFGELYADKDDPQRPTSVDFEVYRKRLTDIELAAEYWRLRLKVCASGNRDMKAVGHVCAEWQAAHDELDTMQRFMELPHYDEVTA